jgi:hypothetical protein
MCSLILLGDTFAHCTQQPPLLSSIRSIPGHTRTPAPKKDIAPCITPNGTLWIRQTPEKDNRLLLGIEKCALQGIYMLPNAAAAISNRDKNKLGGNGFCAPVTLAISIALFIVMAKKSKKQFDAEQLEKSLAEASALDQGLL